MQNHLDRIRNEFEREVFLAAYRSRDQRRRRAQAFGLLLAVHFLRGALIGFPIYLATLALALAPAATGYRWYLLALLPGVAGWTWVLVQGARSDYRRRVHHHLLWPGFARELWTGDQA